MQFVLSFIAVRNVNLRQEDKYEKPYAEKLMLVNEGQITPYHFHWHKMEDLINRGGGILEVKLYSKDPKDPKEGIDYKADVRVSIDGVLIGEVDERNNDNTDNKFAVRVGRFPGIVGGRAAAPLAVQRLPACPRRVEARRGVTR